MPSLPLQSAAHHGQVEAVLALINEFGCDANVRDSSGNTLLHTTCERGYLTLTKTLIQDFNADVNAQNGASYTPLNLAVQEGKEDIAIALIKEFSCNTSVKKGWLGRTLLHSACERGCLNLVQTLIRDHNADINARDNHNDTPLHLVAKGGNEDIAIALINEFSCSMSVKKGLLGRTLLHSACERGCLNLVRTLIRDHNADINARDNHNDTPLHLVAKGGNEDIAIALINEFSCSVSVKKGLLGRTLLHSACKRGCLNLVRTLVRDHNADVNARDDHNNTPLHLAATDIAIALINEFSCSTSVKGWSGGTLLHSACSGGCLNLVRTLIQDHNADVNAQDNDKDTPLHVAIRHGKETIAFALIDELGCDKNVRNGRGDNKKLFISESSKQTCIFNDH